MKIDWKNLQKFAQDGFPKVENKPGIYFIRWKQGENPVIINRLGGSDKKGLLYIGESQKLKNRFHRLWRGICNVESTIKTSHTLQKTIFFCKLHEEIKSDEYEIAWKHLPTTIDAQVQEAVALKMYADKFREPPPLNLNLCKEKYAKWGLGIWDKSQWSGEPDEFVKSIIH